MRSGPAPVPWIAICCFCYGSWSLLQLIYALGEPAMCSRHHCGLLNLAYLLFGRWGVRAGLLFVAALCFYQPFANSNAREL